MDYYWGCFNLMLEFGYVTCYLDNQVMKTWGLQNQT